jgi:hypothetical protein
MNTTVEKISQAILDANHPGKSAREVIGYVCPQLLGKNTSVVELFSSWFYDSFSQVDLDRYDSQIKSPIKVVALLNELSYRLFLRPEHSGLLEALRLYADASQQMVFKYEALTQCKRHIEQKNEYRLIKDEVASLVDECKSITFPFYEVARVMSTMKGQCSPKLRALAFPEPPQLNTAFKIVFPLSDETKTRMANEKNLINNLSDRDLGIRTIHALKRHELSKCDTDLPVYGVESIYALTPWVISTCQGLEVSQERSIGDEVALASMRSLSARAEALLARYERIKVVSTEKCEELEP